MHPAKAHIKSWLPYLLYGIGSLSVMAAGCKKNDDVTFPSSPDIKMEIIPLADTIRHVIASNTLLTASHPWYIDGWVYVTNEATLRIEAGAIIKILPSVMDKRNNRHSGGLVVMRDAHIYAAGTATLPVQITVEDAPNQGASGIILLGKAPGTNSNRLVENPGGPLFSHLAYGGNVPDDSSGVMKHVHINYYPVTGPGFQGGLLLLGTGSHTVTDNMLLRPLPVRKTVLKTGELH